MSNAFPPIPPLPPTPPTSQLPPRRFRRGLVIGAVALGLAGAGGAAVWAADATGSATPSAPASASPSAHPGEHLGKPGAGQFGAQTLHGQMTVKKPDGTIQTIFIQRGTVTDVSDTKVTVKSDDGFTQTYVLNSSTKFLGKNQPRGGAFKPGDVSKGDKIMVRAVQSGSDYVAQQIKKGPFTPMMRHVPGQHLDKRQPGSPSPSSTS
ncbi:DUF5666 domain-containing protein [Sinomonas sp. ASV322]|uniref:DUF5666 domain-containing protein n=1 Tax=Sinomonas sp. ASV322 TaxID=3041920 RepID=UPI0027DE134F|nr:DUF5666 domain-containing protein [Sinomonas sp. ASV322]MDQ4502819.1 DUF5666 domain-containing protein [Sinomonas sp. ASV322]